MHPLRRPIGEGFPARRQGILTRFRHRQSYPQESVFVTQHIIFPFSLFFFLNFGSGEMRMQRI